MEIPVEHLTPSIQLKIVGLIEDWYQRSNEQQVEITPMNASKYLRKYADFGFPNPNLTSINDSSYAHIDRICTLSIRRGIRLNLKLAVSVVRGIESLSGDEFDFSRFTDELFIHFYKVSASRLESQVLENQEHAP